MSKQLVSPIGRIPNPLEVNEGDVIKEENGRWSSGVGGGGSDLPDVTAADNGKVLGVKNGQWDKVDSSAVDPAIIEQAVTDWLDEHPEATTTVEDGSITMAKLESSVAAAVGQAPVTDLAYQNSLYTAPWDLGSVVITQGQYYKSADGTIGESSKYARISLQPGFHNVTELALLSETYEFLTAYYDETGSTSGTGYIDTLPWCYNGEVVLPNTAKKIGISVRRHDQANLTGDDIAAIRTAFTYSTNADPTLTKPGVAADAAITGQNLERLRGYSEAEYRIGFGYTWEQGSISGTDGTNFTSTTRMRTKDYVRVCKGDVIHYPDITTYKVMVVSYLYDSINDTYVFQTTYKSINTQIAEQVVDKDLYLRFVIGYLNDQTMTEARRTATARLFSISEFSGIKPPIHDDTELGYTSSGIIYNNTNTTKYRRSAFPYYVPANTLLKIGFDETYKSTLVGISISFYDGTTFAYQKYFKGYDFDVSDSLYIPNACYIKASIEFSEIPANFGGLDFYADHDIKRVYNPYLKASDATSIAINYPVSPGVQSTLRLILPPNYSVTGKKVPLAVYVHGSTAMVNWTSNLTTSYVPLMNYIADEGFAVIDVYPWTDSKGFTSTDTYSPIMLPSNKNAYIQAIRYVCDRYNVDINQVCLYAKSQGGNLGHWAAVETEFPFKGVGLLATTVDPYMQKSGAIFYNANCRSAILKHMDFEGTQEEKDAFVNTGTVSDPTTQSFLNKNKAKFASLMAFAVGLQGCDNYETIFDGGMTITQTVPQWMLDKGLPERQAAWDYIPSIVSHSEYSKNAQRPVKFWCAPDDANISFYGNYAVHQWLLNGGSDSTFRIMPVGTGAHHSVDTDANAPKSSGTTALGIPYTDIATAYVEMVQFFRYCLTM